MKLIIQNNSLKGILMTKEQYVCLYPAHDRQEKQNTAMEVTQVQLAKKAVTHNKIERFFKKQSYSERKMQYKVHNVLEVLQQLQAMVNESKIFLPKKRRRWRITLEKIVYWFGKRRSIAGSFVFWIKINSRILIRENMDFSHFWTTKSVFLRMESYIRSSSNSMDLRGREIIPITWRSCTWRRESMSNICCYKYMICAQVIVFTVNWGIYSDFSRCCRV